MLNFSDRDVQIDKKLSLDSYKSLHFSAFGRPACNANVTCVFIQFLCGLTETLKPRYGETYEYEFNSTKMGRAGQYDWGGCLNDFIDPGVGTSPGTIGFR